MNNNAKPDEHYLDGKDKWTVRFTVSDDTKINPGDYKETTQYFKNGELVGQTITQKNKDGNNKYNPHETGIQQVPSSAKRVNGTK
jgi:hypothetical protein